MSCERRGAGRVVVSALMPVVFLTGCFTAVAVEPAALPAGEEIMVRLNADASARMGQEAGYTTRTLRGIVAEVNADSLHLSVRSGERYRGMTVDSRRRSHWIPLSDIGSVERFELNRGRTAAVGAGVLAGIVMIAYQIQGSRSGGGDPGGPSPPPPSSPAIIPE